MEVMERTLPLPPDRTDILCPSRLAVNLTLSWLPLHVLRQCLVDHADILCTSMQSDVPSSPAGRRADSKLTVRITEQDPGLFLARLLPHTGGSGLSLTCPLCRTPASCLSTACSLLCTSVSSLSTARLEPDNRNNSYLYPRTRNAAATSFDFFLAAFTILLAVFILHDLITVSSIPCVAVMTWYLVVVLP